MQNGKLVLDRLSSSLVALLEPLLSRKDYAGLIDCYTQFVASADPIEGNMAVGHHLAAKAHLANQELSQALKCARLAQASASKDGDSLVLAEIFLTLGAILRDLGQVRESLRAYTDAESIFRRNDSTEGRCRALNLMASVYFRRTDYRNALSTLLEALELARSLSAQSMIAYMMGNIGRIHTFLGDLAEAKRHLKTNIELSHDLGDDIEESRAWLSLGYAQMQSGEFADAARSFETAYPMIVASGNRRDEAICLSYQGELARRVGQLSQSQRSLDQAMALAERVAAGTTLVGRILRQQAETAVAMQNFRLAGRLIARALPIMESNGDKITCGALWKLRAVIASSDGRFDELKDAMNRSLDLLSESGVKYELAEALLTGGQQRGYSERQRLTYLFRAEEYYTAAGLSSSMALVQAAIVAVKESPSSGIRPSTAGGDGSRSARYLTCSPEVQEFIANIPAFGKSDLPVLLTGETGVGKDMMARHFRSVVCPDGPFVAINCASLPETLLESELFGYVRGAFTGAEQRKFGLLEAANGGVLLLDEIGDMPLFLQAKILGAIDRRRITPLGCTSEIELNVRIVAATNQPLEQLVEQGLFRRDLYYRLSAIRFHIPALKERREDIPLLATHFLRMRGLLGEHDSLPAELQRNFMAYDWPGNTRELEHRIQRMGLAAEYVVHGDLLGAFSAVFSEQALRPSANLFEQVEEFERKLLVEAMRAAGGNKSQAARILGVHEATVRTKLKRYGLEQSGGAPSPGLC